MFDIEVTFQPVEDTTIAWVCEVKTNDELPIKFGSFYMHNNLSYKMSEFTESEDNVIIFESKPVKGIEKAIKEAREFVDKLTTYINACRAINKKRFLVQI